jgi:hypothetical protein
VSRGCLFGHPERAAARDPRAAIRSSARLACGAAPRGNNRFALILRFAQDDKKSGLATLKNSQTLRMTEETRTARGGATRLLVKSAARGLMKEAAMTNNEATGKANRRAQAPTSEARRECQ